MRNSVDLTNPSDLMISGDAAAPPRRAATGRRWLASGLVVVALAACGGDDADDAGSPDAPADVAADAAADIAPGLVTPAQAVALAAEGVTVIDVRTPEEFAEGHLDGATLVDFYDADFADQIAALPTDEEYVIYCRSGNRSGQAATIMEGLGFDQVYDMDGGVIAYGAEGLPLVP